MTASDDRHYFLMKVGNGNFMRDACISMMEDGKGWLYVQYGEYDDWKWMPSEEAGWTETQITAINALGTKQRKQTDDLFWMLSMCHTDEMRRRTRILVYGDHELYVFEPVGKVAKQADKGAEPVSLKSLQSYFEKGCPNSVLKTMRGRLAEKGGDRTPPKTGKMSQYRSPTSDEIWEALSEGTGINYIPVKKVCSLPREKLLPGINSLAVYRYLNQGAFRPLANIGPGRNIELEPIFKPGTQEPRIRALDIFGRDDEWETWMGYHARKYLQWEELKVSGLAQKSFFDYLGSPNIAASVCGKKWCEELAIRLLNPVQLEAAAALVLMGLGFVVDFYTANSLDKIDVRGRKLEAAPAGAMKLFRDATSPFHVKHLDIYHKSLLDQPSIISIQCKDYELSDENKDEKFIYFEPGSNSSASASPNVTTWSLLKIHEWLSNPDIALPVGVNFDQFKSWIQVLSHYYS